MELAKKEFSADQVALIKSQICVGSTDDELALFLNQCKRTGLDPFSRQIYAIMRNVYNPKTRDYDKKMTVQVSVDGFRAIAQRSGVYAGQLGPYWCGEDGVWSDVWLKKGYPSAARVAVLRSDFKEPLWAVARWESYVQVNPKTKEVSSMWAKMPDLMLAKVAESLALRKGFPQELSGLYTSEEIHTDASEPKQEKEVTGHEAPPARQLPSPEVEVEKVEVKRPTEPQLMRLYTIASTRGWPHQKVLDALKTKFNVDSAKLLTIDQYNQVVAGLETLPTVEDNIRH